MRKFLLSCLMVLATIGMVKAEEVTFDMSDPNAYVAEANKVTYSTTQSTAAKYASGTVFTNSPITITTTSVEGNNGVSAFTQSASKNYAIQIRAYENAKFVFETTDGSVITSIKVSGSNFTNNTFVKADVGAISSSTWTGSSKKVEISIVKSTVQINTIVVTTGDANTMLSPKFSVAGGTYYEAQTVTITNPNTTGKVYYTLDGTEPTASSTEYTAPIEIPETKTLKAIVIDGDKKSEVTSATYTISQVKTVNNVAEFLKLTKGEKAKFGSPIVVAAVYTAKSGSTSYYCSDETGGIQLFDKTGDTMPKYKADDVIPAGFEAEYDLYNNVPEAINVTGAVAATETKDAPYTVTTIEEISADMVGAVVQISGASINGISGSNFTISDETGSLASYNKFALEDLKEATGVVVKAVVNIYSNNLQLMPFSIDYSTAVTEVEDSEKVEVVPGSGEIYVNGAGDVNIYNIDGRRTTTVKGSGEIPPKKKSHVIETESGVYIVVVEGEAVKVKVD